MECAISSMLWEVMNICKVFSPSMANLKSLSLFLYQHQTNMISFCALGFGKDMKPWLYTGFSSLISLCGAGSSQQVPAEWSGRGYKVLEVFLILFCHAMGIFCWLHRQKRRCKFLRLQKLHGGSSFHDPAVLKIISTECCSSWKWCSLALIERHKKENLFHSSRKT